MALMFSVSNPRAPRIRTPRRSPVFGTVLDQLFATAVHLLRSAIDQHRRGYIALGWELIVDPPIETGLIPSGSAEHRKVIDDDQVGGGVVPDKLTPNDEGLDTLL